MEEPGTGDVAKDFKLDLKLREATVRLTIPIKLPFKEKEVPELTQLIITSFDLPIFVEKEIETKLLEFVKQENMEVLLSAAQIDPDKIEENIKIWEQAFREETLQYNPPEIVGDDEVFADAYHSLVHSPMLGAVLRKESALNSTIREMHRMKNMEIASLNEKQNLEMTAAISALNLKQGPGNTIDVNSLAAVHFDDAHLVRTRWQSLIESENLKQKREFRDWIVGMYQDFYIQTEEEKQKKEKEKGFKKKHSVRFDDSLMISYGDDATASNKEETMLQESFTIHLGSQIKQMYNIRVMCTHPLDFLRFKNESSREISPQRLQTAISLYSADLSGIVLLIDPEVSLYNSITKDLIQLCQQTTEFHFENFETQLESRPAKLTPGDFLVTRHSNLNSVHVIFLLVVDQRTLNKNEINSRHPVILGLRNILKTACLNNITTITIPALLAHDIAEDMTVTWCNRRAELVYKCVKGFMIEMASWGGAEMKNLQFLAPKDISEDVFNGLASMLPNIFRVANPLRLSSSSSSHGLQQ